MMKYLVILIIMTTYSISYAQWSNVWPSYDYPRQGEIQQQNLYDALLERAVAAGVDEPDAPVWYRTQKGNLTSWKDDCRDNIIPAFVDNSSVTNFDGSGTVSNWSVAAICQAAEIPTNYFDYTPWRCLHELGPFTNDATVGHSYGWVNTTTGDGGTNFPASRTNWYTTDYGRNGLKEVIDLLKWIDQSGTVSTHSEFQSNWYVTASESSPEDAYDTNIVEWVKTNWVDAAPFGGNSFYHAGAAGTVNTKRSLRAKSLIAVSGMTTSFAASVDVYLLAERSDSMGLGGSKMQFRFEDTDGYGTQSNKWFYWESWPESNASNRGGSAEASVIGDFTSNPLSDSALQQPSSTQLTTGVNCKQVNLIFKYDGANGFKFVD